MTLGSVPRARLFVRREQPPLVGELTWVDLTEGDIRCTEGSVNSREAMAWRTMSRIRATLRSEYLQCIILFYGHGGSSPVFLGRLRPPVG